MPFRSTQTCIHANKQQKNITNKNQLFISRNTTTNDKSNNSKPKDIKLH